jgi:hypothetical protein
VVSLCEDFCSFAMKSLELFRFHRRQRHAMRERPHWAVFVIPGHCVEPISLRRVLPVATPRGHWPINALKRSGRSGEKCNCDRLASEFQASKLTSSVSTGRQTPAFTGERTVPLELKPLPASDSILRSRCDSARQAVDLRGFYVVLADEFEAFLIGRKRQHKSARPRSRVRTRIVDG